MSETWAHVLMTCRLCGTTRTVILDSESGPQVCGGLYWPHGDESMTETFRVECTPPGSPS